MVDASEVIRGPARDWLAANRQMLNDRFRQARGRFPKLDAETVLALCRELLPPLAGSGEEGSSALLLAVYDLILLHAGRGTLAPGGGGAAGISILLRQTFPAVRRLLLTEPHNLPAALSNAADNLGSRAPEFAHTVTSLASHVADGAALLAAGAVVAWRLGEARLRRQALDNARRLPPRAALTALGLTDWPEPAAPVVHACLEADAWYPPDKRLSPQTLAGLANSSSEGRQALLQKISAPPPEGTACSTLVGRLGNFIGFEGDFEEPPLLLKGGAQANRHCFFVRSGDTNYRIDADVFGWVCRQDRSIDLPVGRLSKAVRTTPESRPTTWLDILFGSSAPRTTSGVNLPGLVAFTLNDSFRVRVLVPPKVAL